MRKLWKYLTRQTVQAAKLPRLQTSLKNPYEAEELEEETALILMSGVVRDPHAAEKLMEKYHADSAAQLIKSLPPNPGPDIRSRWRNYLQTLEGAYSTDPYEEEWKKGKRLYG